MICKSEEVDEIKKMVSVELSQKYLLKINDKKTEIIDFKIDDKGKLRSFNHLSPKPVYKNLQYLGFEYNGQNVCIRPSSLSRYFRKMKSRITKTVLMAYSSRSKSQRIFKRQLFQRYSHLGNRNFLTYAINASKKFYTNSEGISKEGFDSPTIKRQVSSHFSILGKKMNANCIKK